MTDIMVDVETTGLNPATAGVIQLAGIKFNYETGEVGESFDRCPAMLPMTRWDEGTRKFWMVDHREVYMTIIARQEPAQPVFRAFLDWVGKDEPNEGYRFWAKPTHFDWGFVSTSMERCDLPMPMHFRYARDMNSFIAGLTGKPEHPGKLTDEVPFPEGGSPHNALHDCAWQLDILHHAKANAMVVEEVS